MGYPVKSGVCRPLTYFLTLLLAGVSLFSSLRYDLHVSELHGATVAELGTAAGRVSDLLDGVDAQVGKNSGALCSLVSI